MKTSIIIPTHNRPDGLKRIVESVKRCTKEPYEILVCPNIVGYSTMVSNANRGFKESTGDLMVMFCDDHEIMTEGWNERLMDEMPIDGVWLPNTFDGVIMAYEPIVTRKWTDAVGYFLWPKLRHYYAESWLDDIAKRLDRRFNCGWLHLHHHHPERDPSVPWDETYNQDRKRYADDARLFQSGDGEEERKKAVDRLRKIMT